MEWQDVLVLERENPDGDFRDAFLKAFTLRCFFEYALLPESYSPPEALLPAVMLTPAGREWARSAREAISGLSEAETVYAAFCAFYHRELLVDVSRSDLDAIHVGLHEEIRQGRLKYPWVFGRLLYDRFFAMFEDRATELSCRDTAALLEGTPQGVFQIGSVVVGPFGALESSCYRFLPPVASPPLWHCSDPACTAFHTVRLLGGECNALRAR
jgi:hypothetical protein